MQKLLQLRPPLAKGVPKLFLVTLRDDSNISMMMLGQTEIISPQLCAEFMNLIHPIMLLHKNIFIPHSPQCGARKTESIFKQLVCDKKDEFGPVLHAMISVDQTPIQVSLRRLMNAQLMNSDRGVVLHFNVTHKGKPEEVNLFLFQYLLIGSWRDCHDYTFPHHQNDIIV
eukprot:TRINITY_DN2967_c0_g1_i2.p1 TRINITY_DN2967_c0_g1~~TRINITY_DN2967_c0_g1_i2.p1  ORF type:complete len:170 (+),score=28.61 TRINITY_DN2967_c0_g1_i2:1340-1849(+)